MRKNQFTEEQIIGAPRESEAGGKTTEICRAGNHDGYVLPLEGQVRRDASQRSAAAELKEENRKLKHIVAEQTLVERASFIYDSLLVHLRRHGR